VLGILLTVYPWPLGTQADPLAPAPVGIHPEWYFMAPFQLLKALGHWLPGTPGEIVGMAGVTAAAALWALVPLCDRGDLRGRSAAATAFGYLVLLGTVGLTVWGYLAL